MYIKAEIGRKWCDIIRMGEEEGERVSQEQR